MWKLQGCGYVWNVWMWICVQRVDVSVDADADVDVNADVDVDVCVDASVNMCVQ